MPPTPNPAVPGASAYPIDLDGALADFLAKKGLEQFPSPKVAIKIGSVLSSFNFMVGALVPMVEAEPSLAAAVLRRANANTQRVGPCTSVKDAVRRIGAKQLGLLLVTSKFSQQLKVDGSFLVLRRRLWREALQSAFICEALSHDRKVHGGEAFAAGLQHDFGRIMVIGSLEFICKSRTGLPPMPESFWLELARRHETAVGLAVARLWGIPTYIHEIIARHNEPAPASAKRPDLLELVAIADAANGLINGSGHLSEAGLGAIPHLRSAQERALLSETLFKIPDFINDLSLGHLPPASTAPSPSLVLPPSAQGTSAQVKAIPCSCLSDGKTVGLLTRRIGPESLQLTGKTPLPERFLTQVTLKTSPETKLWAEILSCARAGEEYRIELRPFAMNDTVASHWRVAAPGPRA